MENVKTEMEDQTHPVFITNKQINTNDTWHLNRCLTCEDCSCFPTPYSVSVCSYIA